MQRACILFLFLGLLACRKEAVVPQPIPCTPDGLGFLSVVNARAFPVRLQVSDNVGTDFFTDTLPAGQLWAEYMPEGAIQVSATGDNGNFDWIYTRLLTDCEALEVRIE